MKPFSAVDPGPAQQMGGGARFMDWLVARYQYFSAGRASACRYFPSCSAYSRESLATHGALRGGWLTLRRLGRCHPWGGHGVDLVPERKVH